MSRTADFDPFAALMLNMAFDEGGAIEEERLVAAAGPYNRRRMWHAISRQVNLGNVRRRQFGEPVTLTAAAIAAIAAGRHTVRKARA